MWIVTQKTWLINTAHISSILVTTHSNNIEGQPKDISEIFAIDHKTSAEYVLASYDSREEALMYLGLLVESMKEKKPIFEFENSAIL